MSKSLKLFLVMLVALLALATSPLSAAEKVKVDKLTVKTLPAEVYPLLQKGKKFSLVWKSSAFSPDRGFQIGLVSWKGDDRIGEVTPHLRANLAEVTTPSGFYTLDLTVTESRALKVGISYFTTTQAFYVMEGAVKDPEGKVVAAFVTKEESESVDFTYSLKPGVERTVSGIASELFK